MLRLLQWALEAVFVLSALIVLKLWIFPLFIYLWFQGVSPITEWTALIFMVITCVVYIGLGSAAKYVYGIPWISALLGFVVVHAPLFLNFPFLKNVGFAWHGLFSEGISLFLPKQSLSSLFLISLYAGLFLLGRGIVVEEAEEKKMPNKQVLSQKK